MAGLKKRSPLAPIDPPHLPDLAGVRLTGQAIGLKPSGAPDLMMAELAPGTAVAGTLTRSRCASAPVDWCRARLPGGRARLLVVNSGNANAFTGEAGWATVRRTARFGAALATCPEDEVFLASTGVIGQPMAPDALGQRLGGVFDQLEPRGWPAAAAAIRTTDTFSKLATRVTEIDGNPVTVNGIAKGSGMIGPDMATMLAFIFTDAHIEPAALQGLTSRAVDRSFNCISVDSDTSTSDTVLVFATGAAPHAPIENMRDRRLTAFRGALEDLCQDLARQIVADGEGARKLITIDVTGARSARSARRIGLAIGNSPLVKTAIAGEDANWGRVVMAVGKAGEPASRDRLSIAFGGFDITRNGELVPDYDEAPIAGHLKGDQVHIEVDVGIGRGRARVWTCDLTHDYIAINADYRS